MLYFCESCFKLAHKSEETNSHSKEKIDYYCPIDTKCSIHLTHPLDLFCIDEKGKLMIIIYCLVLCCSLCYYKNMHDGHKVLEITDEDSLKKENITLDNSKNEIETNIKKLEN